MSENVNNSELFSRTVMLLGDEAEQKLTATRVAIFGVGGVGGYALEALVRAGVGTIHVIDADTVSESNLNRQILATRQSVGKIKVDVAKERALSINPNVNVITSAEFYSPENSAFFNPKDYDYVIDAIDTVSAKVHLIKTVKDAGVPIISAMGAGGKLDPTKFEVADIYKTSVCPLARVMRNELKKCGIKNLKVVYSKEESIKKTVIDTAFGEKVTHRVPGSVSFVPSVMGLIIAGEVIKDIVGI